ncbi:MAG: Ig-like domain-containing protein [Deltaproteobacteria bacterium]|nr:Ig-like domain-containing protein [Deltaproteobacteria bacterium]
MNRTPRWPQILLAAWTVAGLMACNTVADTTVVVESIQPAPGSSAVATDAQIRIRLSRNPNTRSIPQNAVVLSSSRDDRPIEGHLSIQDDQVIFTPTEALRQDTTYQFCLHLTGKDGSAPSEYRVDSELDFFEPWPKTPCFSFTTARQLTIRQAYYLQDERQIRLYFSQPVVSESLESVQIRRGDRTLAIRLLYSPSQDRLTISLPSHPTSADPIQLVLPGDIQSTDGSHLADGELQTIQLTGQIRIR